MARRKKPNKNWNTTSISFGKEKSSLMWKALRAGKGNSRGSSIIVALIISQPEQGWKGIGIISCKGSPVMVE